MKLLINEEFVLALDECDTKILDGSVSYYSDFDDNTVTVIPQTVRISEYAMNTLLRQFSITGLTCLRVVEDCELCLELNTNRL